MTFRIILFVFSLFLSVQALAAEKYVTDPEVNATLRAVETAWNQTFGSSSPDYTGSLKDISQTATSQDGRITLTLQTDNVSYSVDYGTLNFDALDPIQTTSCFFSVEVKKYEAIGTGSVQVTTPTGQQTFSCNTVKMGLKNFVISGNINVGDTISFTDITFQIDSSDYYFSFPCGLDNSFFVADVLAQALPKEYSKILKKELKSANSQFSRKAQSKSKSKMKKGIKSLF